MPLHDLIVFVETARFGSMTQAGVKLGRVQSSISLRIKHLEDRLAVRLFDRTPHGLELTSAGKAFLPRASEIISQWNTALEHVRRVKTGARAVKLGVEITEVARNPNLVSKLLSKVACSELRITAGHSRNLLEHVKEGQVDIAVVAGAMPRGIENYKALYSEPTVIASRNLSAFATDVDNFMALIHSQECILYDEMMEIFESKKIWPKILECHSYNIVRSYLGHMDTLTVLPKSMAMDLIVGRGMDCSYVEIGSRSYDVGIVERHGVSENAIGRVSKLISDFYDTLQCEEKISLTANERIKGLRNAEPDIFTA
ncbi:LysR family transcriptional regulator [Gluconobacter potus]|uniref:LysR family transcriptional regulator n=1 Tax=Gluconobacter potus TaxID=2724927 RepID=UPI0039EB34B9